MNDEALSTIRSPQRKERASEIPLEAHLEVCRRIRALKHPVRRQFGAWFGMPWDAVQAMIMGKCEVPDHLYVHMVAWLDEFALETWKP